MQMHNRTSQHAPAHKPTANPSPDSTPSAQRKVPRTAVQRGTLALLAVVCCVWLFWAKGTGEPRLLLAQQESPVTPTVTVTGTATITPTVGPTATKVKRVVNEIRSPQSGDAIARRVQIVGTALVDAFARYDIHITPAGTEDWEWLTSSSEIVHDDILLAFDTTGYADGYYDLRVRAIDINGDYTETYVQNLEIRNDNPPTPTPAPGATSPPTSPLEAPTPTPTPDARRRGDQGPGFFGPDAGAVVRGKTSIVATVNGLSDNPFRRFELSISEAGMERWQLLHSGTEQSWQSPIYTWETTEFPDGLYDLRLRIVYKDSNYGEFYLRNLSVANQGQPRLAFSPPVGLTAPRGGEIVRGTVAFRGNVPALDLLRWELYWSPAGRDAWQFLVSSEEPASSEDILARLDLSQLSSGVYDFRLRIVREDTNYIDTHVRGLRLLP